MTDVDFDVGSIVRARGREWVVLPRDPNNPELWLLRPLGGGGDEMSGVYRPLETIEQAVFPHPNPETDLGNLKQCQILRDAARLGFRHGAGPFRSLSRISIEPRSYQIVPLLMALKLDPVRLLVADDVGIGKTIESLLIARELFDRGEIEGISVLCPPHLAEQWQRAMREQFHLDATLVLASTSARLERKLGPGESLFDHHPFTVVSLDYIKSDRRRDNYVRSCPNMIIVDEAHTCTAGVGSSGRSRVKQMRHKLLQELAENDSRHMILVTATPHSGNEDNFRSLLNLLKSEFEDLPDNLGGDANRRYRNELAKYFVQRQRDDIVYYLGEQTDFPERISVEGTYSLSRNYKRMFTKILMWLKGRAKEVEGDKRRERIRWWSALSLLRALGSSPAAAAKSLRNRSGYAEEEELTEAQINDFASRVVLDLDDDSTEGMDSVSGVDDTSEGDDSNKRWMRNTAKEIEELAGELDNKLAHLTDQIKGMLNEGYNPIVFCRFIPTVDYVVTNLREKLPRTVSIEGVTGELTPEVREERVEELGKSDKRVLVCTDCLSEGINLQHIFDAVIHYDLSWNPTKHEQRNGRVDRFGQFSNKVKTTLIISEDSPIDGKVHDILLKKHEAIRSSLGISVPVPFDSSAIQEAILDGLINAMFDGAQTTLDEWDVEFPQEEKIKSETDELWKDAEEKTKRNRTLFAQHRLNEGVVKNEIISYQSSLGDRGTVDRFLLNSFREWNVNVEESEDGVRREANFTNAPDISSLLELDVDTLRYVVDGKTPSGYVCIGRNHPYVISLAEYSVEGSLDPLRDSPARRCGVVRTSSVNARTVMLILRARFTIKSRTPRGVHEQLAEDLITVAFTGEEKEPNWLETDDVENLFRATAIGNVSGDLAKAQVTESIRAMTHLTLELERITNERADELKDEHLRVREAARASRNVSIIPHHPIDVLGMFIFLPGGEN